MLAGAALLAGTSCASAPLPPPAPHSAADVPRWVRAAPEYPEKLCATGSCGPSFFADDAKICAADNARASLAKSISVSVRSIMVEETRNNAQSVESATVSGIQSWVTDAVLNESAIEGYWYDAEGDASYTKGVMYALACIPKKAVARKNR